VTARVLLVREDGTVLAGRRLRGRVVATVYEGMVVFEQVEAKRGR